MIADAYLKKRYEAGRREADAKWRAWYNRLQAAQQRGEPFDEPPPKMEEDQPDIERAINNQTRWVIATMIVTLSLVAIITHLLG